MKYVSPHCVSIFLCFKMFSTGQSKQIRRGLQNVKLQSIKKIICFDQIRLFPFRPLCYLISYNSVHMGITVVLTVQCRRLTFWMSSRSFENLKEFSEASILCYRHKFHGIKSASLPLYKQSEPGIHFNMYLVLKCISISICGRLQSKGAFEKNESSWISHETCCFVWFIAHQS